MPQYLFKIYVFFKTQPDMAILRQMNKEGKGEFTNSTDEALEKVRGGSKLFLDYFLMYE